MQGTCRKNSLQILVWLNLPVYDRFNPDDLPVVI